MPTNTMATTNRTAPEDHFSSSGFNQGSPHYIRRNYEQQSGRDVTDSSRYPTSRGSPACRRRSQWHGRRCYPRGQQSWRVAGRGQWQAGASCSIVAGVAAGRAKIQLKGVE